MAVALAERRNTADGRFPARPKGAIQMIQSGVAVLDKGDGHCLWTAPWLESSESLCIRHYQMDGVLVSRPAIRRQNAEPTPNSVTPGRVARNVMTAGSRQALSPSACVRLEVMVPINAMPAIDIISPTLTPVSFAGANRRRWRRHVVY